MLYLEVAYHHPLSDLKPYNYLMFHEDYLYGWKSLPIQYIGNSDNFEIEYPTMTENGSEDTKREVDPDYIVLRPDMCWFKGRFLSEADCLGLCTNSKYGWTGNNLNDYTPLKEERKIRFNPISIEEELNNRFNEFELLFNRKIDISHFEQWCVSEFKLQGFVLKTSGPINLLQVNKFKVVVDPNDNSKEKREYSKSSFEELIYNILDLDVKANTDAGLYRNIREQLVYLSWLTCKFEG